MNFFKKFLKFSSKNQLNFQQNIRKTFPRKIHKTFRKNSWNFQKTFDQIFKNELLKFSKRIDKNFQKKLIKFSKKNLMKLKKKIIEIFKEQFQGKAELVTHLDKLKTYNFTLFHHIIDSQFRNSKKANIYVTYTSVQCSLIDFLSLRCRIT